MRYVHQDHLGSTSVITDDTDRLYTGQRFDAATGLYYYNARYGACPERSRRDPTLARFISPDTIVPGASDPQAWNRYAYVRGNPLRYVDPSGHCFERNASGRVTQTYGTWLNCAFDDIQRYADDVGALASWLDEVDLVMGLEAYKKSDFGAKLASDLVLRGYDGLLAMMGFLPSSGCSVSSATNLDCSALKPAPKQRVTYIDGNVSAAGATGGVIVANSGIYVYVGFCLCGPGYSVTLGLDEVTEGWNSALQAGYWVGGQVGHDRNDEFFREIGLVHPGGGFSHFYVKLIWGY